MSYNTAIGSHALYNNTTGGNYNSAIGAYSLYSNTTGNYNTASGINALRSNNTGTFNTANGSGALYSNRTGNGNTANGVSALLSNTIGNYNTANGADALRLNTTGTQNTANGNGALNRNGTGNYNTANGNNALVYNAGGTQNTANGVNALYYNAGGNYNTASGVNALYHNNGSNNTGLGLSAGFNLTTGSGNVCIGQGVLGVAGESNTTRIRNVYASVASGRAVYVNSDNKIGTLASTRRVKENIKPMDKASEAILALKPVSFRYKKEIDASHTPQFGLIAEDVADISPDLVTRDAEGKPETVRYDSINAMLLNEFLKEHNEFIKEHGKVQELEATVAKQQKQIEALAVGLQKVSAQVEMSRAPQIVSSNQ